MPILELKDVRYSYSPEKVVLRGVNCVFECGTLYALVGKSGAGKSTLLSLMAGLDLPESGQVLFDGTPTGDMDLDEYRRRKAAVIYQDFALFPMLTALENIEYPMELCHVDAKEARQQALALARRVSLPEELLDRYPTHISGGEQQRVAIARGLTMDRRLLLADEPTTALDATIQGQILSLITEQSRKRGMAVLFITHDLGVVARIADNVGVMYAGHLVEHAPTAELFRNPLHPYTRGLMRSAPGRAAMGMQRLPAITGSVPSLDNMPEGCPFAPRCDEALPRCFESAPVARCENGHSVACWAV